MLKLLVSAPFGGSNMLMTVLQLGATGLTFTATANAWFARSGPTRPGQFCSSCGSPVQDGGTYCGHCGARR